ncbi:hypothetical protein MPH_02842 [Macrophomina phaseolina MS6]|uniref:F-box domain-containing protein n=1 Tax=Macrophomina phaseolina (strain MS6) TaxID=1126212 RepID=K2SSZ5_MACPH|nr:hypothetical protein MPH_02842 [Macrophomina phaseolina MS6]
MSIQDLSQEIVDMIVAELIALHPRETFQRRSCIHASLTFTKQGPRPWLSSLSSVSRVWQNTVEQHTFRTLYLTPARLHGFPLVVTGRRCRFVRHIDLRILHDELPWQTIESEADRQCNSRVFTRSLYELFSILAAWPPNHPGVYLMLHKFVSPQDVADGLEQYIPPDALGSRLLPQNEERSRRYKTSYLELIGTTTLPEVHVLHKLRILSLADRKICPASATAIAARLPNLQTFWADVVEYPFADAESRRAVRAVDTELFWPADAKFGILPFWPRLAKLRVGFRGENTAGQWLFERDPNDPSAVSESETDDEGGGAENDETGDLEGAQIGSIQGTDGPERDDGDEAGQDLRGPAYRKVRRFRIKPVEELFEGLYLAAARAATRMPKLRMFWFGLIPHHDNCYQSFEFAVVEKSERCDTRVKAVLRGQPPFHPSVETMGVWKDVARCLGRDLSVEFRTERPKDKVNMMPWHEIL